MIDWEKILPPKRDEDFEYQHNHNRAIDHCLAALKLAESLGEICKPLNATEIADRLHECECYPMSIEDTAHAIFNLQHNRTLGKKE